MVNTCCIVFCKSEYKKRKNKIDVIEEKHPIFSFLATRPDICSKWIKFANRKNWKPSKNCGICAKHFDEKFFKKGVWTTLR